MLGDGDVDPALFVEHGLEGSALVIVVLKIYRDPRFIFINRDSATQDFVSGNMNMFKVVQLAIGCIFARRR